VRRNIALIVALVSVFSLVTVFSAAAALQAESATANDGWTRLGGDPLVPAGVNTRNDFVRLMTSNKGSTAMTYAGLNASERAAVVRAARTGDFRSCSLRYGMTFQRMSFGINGTSVDRNVTFRDPRYRNRPAAAWCLDVRAGSKVVHLLVPRICGNIAVINRTPAPVVVKTKPATVSKPGKVKILIRKQAFSAAAEEQLIYPTPTNVFRFKVQCGLKGKPRYIVYQSDPQPAGTCMANTGRVRIWELDTLGPDKWQHLSPVYQTFKLKGKKRILAVFKNKQVKVVQPPPPQPPPTPNPPPPGCTSNCNPPPPAKHSCSLTVGNASKDDPYTANASVSTDTAAKIVVNWGDGQVSGPGSHTYSTPAPGPAGTGVTYTITATATFSDGQTMTCGSANFFVPAPPPNGDTDPPPPPPG